MVRLGEVHSSAWRGSDSCQGLLISEGLLWPDEAPEMKKLKQSELAKMEGLCLEVWSRIVVLIWSRCGGDSGLLET